MIKYSLGFLFCLGLLFYFIAKYKESDSQEEEFSWEEEFDKAEKEPFVEVQQQPKEADQTAVQDFFEDVKEDVNTVQQVQKLFTKTEALPAREIFDLKDKVKDFLYISEENRLLEEKHYNELKTLAANLEKRLSAFENEYTNNLYPILTTLIQELESLQNKSANK
ncbi:MAG: hypothetical protein J6S61_04425 [Elusimicrobiaceae bacterium]|nr:hypothetical protein [Elusimicrobiaceae bacterium]